MELNLTGKTALVTGASQGIGRAIAKGLAAEGVKVCITARRGELLEELAKEIVASGGSRPQIAVQNMMEEGAPQKLVEKTLEGLGSIDILVNCAGGANAFAVDTPEQKWADALTLNYTRVRQITLAVLPGMIRRQWGRIINITGKSEPAGLTSATAAKAAVHGFAKGLSRVVGKHGITINSIPPGRIMSEQILRNYTPEFRARQAAEDIPLQRYGDPEELACLVVFLASPVASYITGTVMPVDGGLRRYAF